MSALSIHEVSVKKTATLLLLIVMTFTLFVAGCGWRKSSTATTTAPTTQTIAPAAGQPAVNGGDAVTQTVDVEDGRSEDDGGVLTNPQTTKAPGTAKVPAKPPAKKKK
jgi:uncharacterized lipoprotein YajG